MRPTAALTGKAAPPRLTFDPATHLYRVDGRVVPSVTQLLEEWEGASFARDEYAADLGTRVHHATAALDRGEAADIAFDIEPFVTTWQRFQREHTTRWRIIETPTFHPTLLYAGCADRIGLLNNAVVVLDLKTGSVTDTHGLQLAGYDILYPYFTRRRRIGLYLDPPRYRICEYDDPADYNTFMRLAQQSLTNRRKDDRPDHRPATTGRTDAGGDDTRRLC